MDTRVSLEAPLFCDACALGKHSLYGAVHSRNSSEVTAMRSLRRNFLPGQTILREGEIPATVYTLYAGWAYRFKMLPDGSRYIGDFYIPGDFIHFRGLLPERVSFAVKALTAVHACGFDRQAMHDRVYASREMLETLHRQMRERADAVDEMAIDLARRPAESRLLRFLVMIGERLKSRRLTTPHGFDLPIPQAVLADALAVTPVYLNRMLVNLRERGVVDIGRKHIIVPDPARLAELATESAAA